MTALSSAPSRTGRASGIVSCAAVIASFAREIVYTPPDALGELRRGADVGGGALEEAAAIADGDAQKLESMVLCPSPSNPTRSMTVREQLESFAAHNAYHLGRVVLLRQLLGSWPPPSGGLMW